MSALARGRVERTRGGVALPTPRWSFTLILNSAPSDEQAEALYACCPDATTGARAGVPYVAFDRVAPSLADAVERAIRDVEEAAPGTHVVRVEPDELVNAADIARRTGRTRASVSQLIEGERGPGNFPAPRAWMGTRPLWDWLEVAGWFSAHHGAGSADVRSAAFLNALNGALGVCRIAPRLSGAAERRLLTRLIRQSAELLATPSGGRSTSRQRTAPAGAVASGSLDHTP